MKTKVKRLTTVLVVLLALGAAGWGIRALAQSDAAAEQMEMMKKISSVRVTLCSPGVTGVTSVL